MNDDRIYCGSAKVTDGKNGIGVLLLLGEKDLAAIENRWQEVKDSKFRVVKIRIWQRKQPSERGFTHYAVIDTWEPDKQNDQAAAATDEPRY